MTSNESLIDEAAFKKAWRQCGWRKESENLRKVFAIYLEHETPLYQRADYIRLENENKAYRAALQAANDIAFQKPCCCHDNRMMNMWHVINNALKILKA